MVYSVPEKEFHYFIETGINPFMGAGLACSIARQFGNHEDFSLAYYEVALNGIKETTIKGFDNDEALIDFFDTHKIEILNFVADFGRAKKYKGIPEFVADFNGVKNILSSRDVYEGVYNKDSPQRKIVIPAIVIWIAETLCEDYYLYMQGVTGISF